MRTPFPFRKLIHTVALLIAAGGIAMAQAIDFDFKDPKGVNTIAFGLDSLLEPLRGYAAGVSGTISFDPENPSATRGRIQVRADSLSFANDRMASVLKSQEWMDAATHPLISFTFREVVSLEGPEENTFLLQVRGDFECRGVSKEMTLPISLTYLPGKLAERTGEESPGDLLVLRTDFTIARMDFNIRPDLDFGKVARDIRIDVAIAGGAPLREANP